MLAVYTTRIEAERDEAPVLLANGNPVCEGEVAGTHAAFRRLARPYPKPSYLFALVGGRLGRVAGRFRHARGRDVELGVYVEPGKEDRAGYALDALKRSMRWDEEAFGREYDLDVFNIVAVSDFNMGAMENKGLNIFNDKYVLASAETATDADYAKIEAIIAHEYFHNWTGNRDHLPRLVPALPEGRADRLPRPGIHRPTCARARCKRIADVRTLARSAVRRGCRPPRPSGAPAPLSRDQQLLHGDRLREGRRGHPHAARR